MGSEAGNEVQVVHLDPLGISGEDTGDDGIFDGAYRREAQIAEEGPSVPEEGSYKLGDGKERLPVGHTEKEVPAQPHAPGFPALGVA